MDGKEQYRRMGHGMLCHGGMMMHPQFATKLQQGTLLGISFSTE